MSAIDIINNNEGYHVGKTCDNSFFIHWTTHPTIEAAWREAKKQSERHGYAIDIVSGSVKQEVIGAGLANDDDLHEPSESSSVIEREPQRPPKEIPKPKKGRSE